MEEVCMHLTNYAINKDNPKFVFNESEKDMSKGHKRSLTSVYELMKNQGVDVDSLKTKIKDCIIKTMISGLPHLTNTYKSCQPENYSGNMCFELLGFDVLLN
jgi:tubulin polyglutamylase TTLL6/13